MSSIRTRSAGIGALKQKAIAEESSKGYLIYLEVISKKMIWWEQHGAKIPSMGFMWARRYTSYKGECKYYKNNDYELLERGTGEDEKALAADIIYQW